MQIFPRYIAQKMPNIDDDIRKSGKRLKALRKTASAHNKANRIFVYKRDGHNVSEDSLKSQMRSKGLSTESRAAQLRNMVAGGGGEAGAGAGWGMALRAALLCGFSLWL